MSLDVFAGYLAEICGRSPLAADRPLRWTIIANPRAGGFTINRRWKRHQGELRAAAASLAYRPPRQNAAPSRSARGGGSPGLIPTRRPGHGGEICAALLDEMRSEGKAGESPFHLIICAGGDGTSLEVLTVLAAAPEDLRSRCAVLRLPMGTGNDGADAWELREALEFLTRPSELVLRRGLRLLTSTPGKGPFPAFNILSVGLDAFVTHMTNRMKGKLPGDSYKLWVDIAALLYDRIYRVGPLEVRAFDGEGRECAAFREELLLLAVGASGRRTYGSHKRILPDDRNVCAVRQMPLFRKLALKGLFSTGEHVLKPEARLFNARRVEFRSEYPILAQMDGETVLLERGDFPAAIELTEPLIPTLRILPEQTQEYGPPPSNHPN
jgi:diacylglycerol kinase family enzyme